MRVLSVMAVAAVATLAVLSADHAVRAGAGDGESGQDVLVVGRDQAVGSACQLGRVGRTLVGFTEALRRGNLDRLARYWRPRFNSFGIGDRAAGSFVAAGTTPEEALASVSDAGKLRVRLSVAEVSGSGGLSYRGAWLGDQHPRLFSGKAEVDCDARNVWVWQAAIFRRPPSRGARPFCPEPDEPRRGALVICRR